MKLRLLHMIRDYFICPNGNVPPKRCDPFEEALEQGHVYGNSPDRGATIPTEASSEGFKGNLE